MCYAPCDFLLIVCDEIHILLFVVDRPARTGRPGSGRVAAKRRGTHRRTPCGCSGRVAATPRKGDTAGFTAEGRNQRWHGPAEDPAPRGWIRPRPAGCERCGFYCRARCVSRRRHGQAGTSVSYTHLTLPTIYSV